MDGLTRTLLREAAAAKGRTTLPGTSRRGGCKLRDRISFTQRFEFKPRYRVWPAAGCWQGSHWEPRGHGASGT